MNQMVLRFESNYFYFESRIVSDYVSNCNPANYIVKLNASKPIILYLRPDTGRDRLTFVSIHKSLWSNRVNIVSSNITMVDQSILNANTL